jgi:hypothetical protein
MYKKKCLKTTIEWKNRSTIFMVQINHEHCWIKYIFYVNSFVLKAGFEKRNGKNSETKQKEKKNQGPRNEKKKKRINLRNETKKNNKVWKRNDSEKTEKIQKRNEMKRNEKNIKGQETKRKKLEKRNETKKRKKRSIQTLHYFCIFLKINNSDDVKWSI